MAYALDRIEHTMVIDDTGAGTTDICRVYGTIPGPDDQVHTGHAGDYVDNQIIVEIQKKYNRAQVTKDMARRWKESHAFVSIAPPEKPVIVDFPIDGKAMSLGHHGLHRTSMREHRRTDHRERQGTDCQFEPRIP